MCLLRVSGQDQRQNDTGNVVAESVTPPDQKDVVNKAFYKQVAEVFNSQVFVHIGNFNQPNTYWEGKISLCRQLRRCLHRLSDNSLARILEG